MKVIDLLNKIVNGEEVPKKILYRDYEYSFKDSEYRDFMDDWVGYDNLNYEIEIIEEEKDIEELEVYHQYDVAILKDKITKREYEISLAEEVLVDKINELIDIVKELRSKE